MLSFSEYMRKIRSAVVGTPTMLDCMLKAMAAKAAAPYRPRRPKRRLFRGEPVKIGTVAHRLPRRKGVERTRDVPLYYAPMFDASKYPGKKLRNIRADGEHR